MNAATTTLDCRGQRCPSPILAAAKAARRMGSEGGGTIEIAADDDAFPFDIRSWCRSSGSELVDLRSGSDGVHTAVVRVTPQPERTTTQRMTMPPRLLPPPANILAPHSPPASGPTTSPWTILPRPAGSVQSLDYRGQRCPAPVLGLARYIRTVQPGSEVEVVADDPAFRLDIASWCRTSGSTLVSLTNENGAHTFRARIRVAGGSPNLDAAPITTAPSEANTTMQTTTNGTHHKNGTNHKNGTHHKNGTTLAHRDPEAELDEPFTLSLLGVDRSTRFQELKTRVADQRVPRIRVLADSDFSSELLHWAMAEEHSIVSLHTRPRLEAELELKLPEPPVTAIAVADKLCTLLVLRNDREALLAALLVAVGAAAQGMKVMMYFSFWGLNLLRGDRPNEAIPEEPVSLAQRLFKWMMPRGPKRQKLGKLNMGGIGTTVLGTIMKQHHLMDIPELMSTAEAEGVRFVACTMSMQVMGITKRDLAPYKHLEYGGVAAFVASAATSRMSLTF